MNLEKWQINRIIRVLLRCTLISIVVCSQATCAASPVQQELDNLCDLYKPESWSEVEKNAPIQDVYAFISARQAKVVNNKEVLSILANADTSSYSSYFYAVKSSLKKLLGQEWVCKAFDDFYLPEQSVVTFSLSSVSKKRIDPQSSNVITIMLANNGTLLVNNASLISSDMTVLKKALESQLSQKAIEKINVVLYLDEGSNGGRMADILSVLVDVGIHQVDIIQIE